MTAEQVSAGAAVAQAVLVVGGLIFAGVQLKAARKLREDQATQAAETLRTSMRPYVTAHLDAESVHGIVYLIIENHGRSPALDVSFDVSPPLDGSVTHAEELTPLNDGISSIVPRQRTTCAFEYIFGRPDDLPRRWDVMVSYRSSDGVSYNDAQTLDFGHKWGSVILTRNGLHEIHDQLDRIRKELATWSAPMGHNGIHVRTDQDLDAEREEHERRRDELIAERNSAAQQAEQRHE